MFVPGVLCHMGPVCWISVFPILYKLLQLTMFSSIFVYLINVVLICSELACLNYVVPVAKLVSSMLLPCRRLAWRSSSKNCRLRD
jgi:hypothetical protein